MKKILLDENIPLSLRSSLSKHLVTTVQKEGWCGIKNGELIRLIDDRFDIFITADKNLRYQQNLAQRRIAIIELPFNSRRLVMPLVEKILQTVETAQPNDYLAIEA